MLFQRFYVLLLLLRFLQNLAGTRVLIFEFTNRLLHERDLIEDLAVQSVSLHLLVEYLNILGMCVVILVTLLATSSCLVNVG